MSATDGKPAPDVSRPVKLAPVIVVRPVVTKSSAASISKGAPVSGREATAMSPLTLPLLKKNGSSAQADEAARIDRAATSRKGFDFMTVLLGDRMTRPARMHAARSRGEADCSPPRAALPPLIRGVHSCRAHGGAA